MTKPPVGKATRRGLTAKKGRKLVALSERDRHFFQFADIVMVPAAARTTARLAILAVAGAS